MVNDVWDNGKSFTVQLLTGRFFTVFGTIMILSFCGTSYIFGLYSNEIKSNLGYDQTTLNLISFFKDLGAYISVHAGLIMEVYPPWVVLTLGAVVNFVGYFMIWLSVTHRVASPSVWQMCLYICIGANSFGFANTGALVTCVKNFPENRGPVIGILKAYIGLGGAIITQLYHAIYGNDTNTTGVILLISWLPAVPLLLFSYSIRSHQADNRQVKWDKKFFKNVFYLSLVLAVFITAMIVVQKNVKFSHSGYGATSGVIMVLLILPLVLVITDEYAAWSAKHRSNVTGGLSDLRIMQQEGEIDFTPQPNGCPSSTNVSCYQDVFCPPPIGEDHTILQATFSLDMLLLLLCTVCGVGGNLTTIDNLGQIGTSLGYPKKSMSTLVSLIAIWQYLGRVMGGLISEYFLAKYKWPRPLFYAITIFLACIGHLLIAFNVPYGLYISSIIVGFCFGAGATYIFAIISELFGLKYYATLFNYGALAGPLTSYIFNVRVAGHLYDKEGAKQLEALGLTRKPGQELNCKGVKCYQLAYIIISAVTFFSGILCLILTVRTRNLYKGDIYKRFQKGSKVLPSVTNEDLKQSSPQKEELDTQTA